MKRGENLQGKYMATNYCMFGKELDDFGGMILFIFTIFLLIIWTGCCITCY